MSEENTEKKSKSEYTLRYYHPHRHRVTETCITTNSLTIALQNILINDSDNLKQGILDLIKYFDTLD